jgi:PAS domain S-box-containing protein
MDVPPRRSGGKETELSEAVIDAAWSPICVLDPAGRIVRWNRAAAALTGLPAHGILGKSFEKTLLFPEDLGKWQVEFARILADSTPRHFEIRWRTRDGPALSLTCSCSVIRDLSDPRSADDAGYAVCTVIDSLSREFMQDRTAELHALSRVLHDTISQDLVALSFKVGNLRATADSPVRQTETTSAVDLIDRCCRHIRVLSYMLAPPLLSEGTLEASIERFTGYVREETGLAIALDVDPVSDSVSPEAQLLMLTVVQAWIVRGMGSAPRFDLTVRLRNQAAWTVLELEMARLEPAVRVLPSVFPPDAGWSVIRERARAFGGEFDITADSTRARARISLPGSSEA